MSKKSTKTTRLQSIKKKKIKEPKKKTEKVKTKKKIKRPKEPPVITAQDGEKPKIKPKYIKEGFETDDSKIKKPEGRVKKNSFSILWAGVWSGATKKKNKCKKTTKKKMKLIWKYLNGQASNISRLGLILSFVFAMTTTGIVTISVIPDKIIETKKADEKFGLLQRLKSLKESHNYYVKMATKNELIVSWIKQFGNWRYVSGGDPRYNTGDCIGAAHKFLRSWGANVAFENVKKTVGRINNLVSRGEQKKRKNRRQIKTGDIIIIRSSRGPSHIGIIYDVTTTGYIRYMDVNSMMKTWGLQYHKWKDWSIYGIYEISYSFWVGNLMVKINRL